MLFDYSLLPPEINSTRMYGGAGAGSMQAAATGWDSLSAELLSTAGAYEAVVAELAGMQWLGPAAAAMTASAIPYVAWLYETAELAKQTAMQASAAAAAFEQAYALTVPPPLVLANRLQLKVLIATNFFGQNTGAIAATEAHYAEMWAVDAAAMNDYASTSSAAAALTPFDAPDPHTTVEGPEAQSGAVTQALGEASGGSFIVRETLALIENLLLQISPDLQGLVDMLDQVYAHLPSIVKDDFSILDGVLAGYTTIGSINNLTNMSTSLLGAEKTLGILPSLAGPVAENVPAVAPELLGALNRIAAAASGAGVHPGAGGISATMSSAGRIGQMSVPHAWAATEVNAVRAVAGTPLTTVSLEDGPAPGGPVVPAMPLAGSGRTAAVPRYGSRLTVMTRPLSGG